MAERLKLTIELVPQTCWFSNVRSHVTKTQWDHIRKQVYTAAYDTCEICGGIGDKHPVECHEVWNYDDKNHIQKLERMIALCPDCHAVKHAGFYIINGKDKLISNHFNKVNKVKNCNKYMIKAMEIWTERSKFEWTLDISILSEYGIDVNKLKVQNNG